MSPMSMPQPPDQLQQALAYQAQMQPQPQRGGRLNAASYIPQGNDQSQSPLQKALRKKLGLPDQDQQGGQPQAPATGQQQQQPMSLGHALLQTFLGGLFGQ